MSRLCAVNYTAVGSFGCFRHRPDQLLAWDAANGACRLEGATLAVLESRAELEAVRSAFGIPNDLPRWVGARREAGSQSTARYLWLVSGAAIPNDSPLWFTGEPTRYRGRFSTLT